jgi:hypothetical protein
VRSDGVLLGLTYMEEEDVWGWHRHDTDGLIEQVVVLPEGSEDAVYVVVRRTIAAATVRYIERLQTRTYASIVDAFFVDAGVTYSGAPATTITGLSHLNGKTVSVFGDGALVPGTFVVSAGAITLPAAKSVVHVGLPITAELELLDLDVQGSSLRDQRKRIVALSLLLEASMRGFSAGPDAAHLKVVRAEAWDSSTLVTGKVELQPTSLFTDTGRVLIRHTDPTPLTILGVLPHLEVGG